MENCFKGALKSGKFNAETGAALAFSGVSNLERYSRDAGQNTNRNPEKIKKSEIVPNALASQRITSLP
ncbi:MAG: hypothetical protein KDK41_02190 [Leptospiraceae bacterium]|nr:hypothetical protein [Leptospiraceae bacterium]